MRKSASSFNKASGVTLSNDKNNQARENIDSALSGDEQASARQLSSDRKLRDESQRPSEL